MADNWWARKLAQTQGPQPLQQPPTMFARGPAPYQHPQQQQYVQAPPVAPQNFADAIAAVQRGILPTNGDVATRTETQPCPACGSTHFFSRRNGGAVTTQRGMATPAPQCYTCGYNGKFEQADPANWSVGST